MASTSTETSHPRGVHITEHLRDVMGYSMRTADWRYTEWVGIDYLGEDAYVPVWDNQVTNTKTNTNTKLKKITTSPRCNSSGGLAGTVQHG